MYEMRNTSPSQYEVQHPDNSNTERKTKDEHAHDVLSSGRTTTSDFRDRTTFHGLRYALQPDISTVRRLIWCLVILTCAGMLLLQIVDRVLYYHSLPVNVDLRVNYNSSLLFPAVTICNQNAFKTTLADKLNLYHVLEKLYSASGNLTVDDLQHYGLTNTTLDEIFFQTAHRKDDFITKCYWNGKKCGPGDFDLIATDHGICYTFNNRQVVRLTSSVGSGNGLRLTLNVEKYEYMSGPRDTVGVKILFHPKGDVPRVHALGHAVSTGTHAFVGLKMVHVENMPRPHGTCNNRSLEYMDQYTGAGCQMDCLTRIAYAACHCRHYYMLHRHGIPPVCTLYQYVTCLKPLLDSLVSLPEVCNCPVSCEYRFFHSDMSYGSTSKYAMQQFVNDKDTEKLTTARMLAMEVTSRMRNATWHRVLALDSEFIHNLADIEEVLLVNLSNRVEELTSVLAENIVDSQNLYNMKEYLYNIQIYIVQSNFVGAKDDMEEQTIEAVVLAYKTFIMKIEENIRLLTDRNSTNPSVRLMLHRSASLMLMDRIEMVRRAYVNYTTLKDAYETGSSIFNNSFKNISGESILVATPKYLLMDAPIHNQYARDYGKLLFVHLNNLQIVLTTLLDMTDIAYETGSIDNDNLVRQRELFQKYMRRFVFARSVFYFETVEWPIGILQTRLHAFHNMWHRYTEVARNVKQRLQSMHTKLQNINTEFFHPLAEIKHKMENYKFFQNETRFSISESLTSERIKNVIYYFRQYFKRLSENEVTLIDWIKLMEKEETLMWKTVVDDKDSREYHTYRHEHQYMRNFSDVKSKLISHYTYLENLCHFSSIASSKESVFENTLMRIIADSRAYKESASIDSEFVRGTFLQIDVFYKQLRYEEVRQQVGYDIFALLCDIGGSMGLLLGASVLSVFEIIEFGFTQTVNRIKAIAAGGQCAVCFRNN